MPDLCWSPAWALRERAHSRIWKWHIYGHGEASVSSFLELLFRLSNCWDCTHGMKRWILSLLFQPNFQAKAPSSAQNDSPPPRSNVKIFEAASLHLAWSLTGQRQEKDHAKRRGQEFTTTFSIVHKRYRPIAINDQYYCILSYPMVAGSVSDSRPSLELKVQEAAGEDDRWCRATVPYRTPTPHTTHALPGGVILLVLIVVPVVVVLAHFWGSRGSRQPAKLQRSKIKVQNSSDHSISLINRAHNQWSSESGNVIAWDRVKDRERKTKRTHLFYLASLPLHFTAVARPL